MSNSGFKMVASRKKRKGGVLIEGINNREVAAKAPGACSWSSETDDTTESESIDMEEKCLVEKTSVDYSESSAFAEGDPNQMPKSLYSLSVNDYGTVNTNNDVLDDSFLLLPLLSIKLFVQVPVCKSFALDINLVAIAGKFSQEKLSFIRKIFLSVNGFGGASIPSKFGGVIRAIFTSEKAMMAAGKLANDHGVVVNTDFKCLVNNCTNRDIVIKEIPVGTLIEVVHAAVSKFGVVVSIKMQLADLLASKWFILIAKDVVQVARADVDKQTWDSRDEFKTLFYTFPVGTNAHDLWDFIGSVGEKTCVIEHNLVNYTRAHCATLGSIRNGKPFSPVVNNLEKHLVSIESSLVSLVRQIGKLAKRLELFMLAVSQPSPGCQLPVTSPSQNQGENIVMKVGSGDATSDKTAAISGSTILPEVVKLENMLEGLSASVMSLSTHLDGLALAGGASSLPLSQ
ncbi:hypothetical protein G9A89_022096 [Geosiphon pyriformis]|nr:hypothetical protein G9A89_022096 [Geosiphon pyriformis]